MLKSLFVFMLALLLLIAPACWSKSIAPGHAATIISIGDGLIPTHINNKSEVIVRRHVGSPGYDEYAVWRHGTLTWMGLKGAEVRGIDDQGRVLFYDEQGLLGPRDRVYLIAGNHRTEVALLSTGSSLDPVDTSGNGDVLVMSDNGVGIYRSGKIQWLHPPLMAHATAVNDKGVVIGQIGPFTDQAVNGVKLPPGKLRGFVWRRGVLQNLRNPWAGYVQPEGINNRGNVVGVYRTRPSEPKKAILWMNANSDPIDLNSLCPDPSAWKLESASSINDKGEIVGVGLYHGVPSGFVLTLPADHR